MTITSLFYFLGRAICHQLPERTFFISETYLPVCARDTGIFIGLFSTFFYLLVSGQYKANQIPTIRNSFALLLFTIPIAFDGLTSYMHIRESSNLLRITTGIPFGIVLPFFLVPMLGFNHQSAAIRRVLNQKRELLIPLFIGLCLGLLTYINLIPYILISTLILISLCVWGTLLVFLLLKPFKHIPVNYPSAAVLCLLILALLSQLNELLRTFYLPYLQG